MVAERFQVLELPLLSRFPLVVGRIGGAAQGFFDGGADGRAAQRLLCPLGERPVDFDGGALHNSYIVPLKVHTTGSVSTRYSEETLRRFGPASAELKVDAVSADPALHRRRDGNGIPIRHRLSLWTGRPSARFDRGTQCLGSGRGIPRVWRCAANGGLAGSAGERNQSSAPLLRGASRRYWRVDPTKSSVIAREQRSRGHDVISMHEEPGRGTPNEDAFSFAQREGRPSLRRPSATFGRSPRR